MKSGSFLKHISDDWQGCRNLSTYIFLLTLFSMLGTQKPCLAFSELTDSDKQYQQAKTYEELEKVAKNIRTLLQAKPNQPEWEWRLARSHYSLAKHTDSENLKYHHFTQCIERSSRSLVTQPDSAIGYFYRALCRGKQGEMEGIWASLEVIEPFEMDMKQALQLDPSIQHGGPLRALGNFYLELPFFLGGNLDQSVYYLEEAVRLAPDFAENHWGLARAYYAQHNFKSAKNSLLILMRLTDKIEEGEGLFDIRTQAQALMKKLASLVSDTL